MLDEPTRGIDIGAKREIYKLMEKLAGEGMAILFVSSEMEEILGMADRAYVMHEGTIAGELDRDQLSEESIMHLATGNFGSCIKQPVYYEEEYIRYFYPLGGDICDYRNDQSKVFERVQHAKPHQVVQLICGNEPGGCICYHYRRN